MHERPFVGVAIALFILLLAGACSRFVLTPTAGSGNPTLGGQAGASAGNAQQPNASAAPAQNVSAQVPVCEAITSCAALDAEQIPLDCVKKVPYTNVLVPEGTTFQVLEDSGEYACIDSGVVVNGKEVLTCHGTQLYSFQLKLTNPSCSTTLESGAGRCQDGYGYDAANKCCAPVGASGEGSATVTVNLGACPLPSP